MDKLPTEELNLYLDIDERVYRKNCVKFKNKPSYDKIKKS